MPSRGSITQRSPLAPSDAVPSSPSSVSSGRARRSRLRIAASASRSASDTGSVSDDLYARPVVGASSRSRRRSPAVRAARSASARSSVCSATTDIIGEVRGSRASPRAADAAPGRAASRRRAARAAGRGPRRGLPTSAPFATSSSTARRESSANPPSSTARLSPSVLAASSAGTSTIPGRASARSATARVPDPDSRAIQGSSRARPGGSLSAVRSDGRAERRTRARRSISICDSRPSSAIDALDEPELGPPLADGGEHTRRVDDLDRDPQGAALRPEPGEPPGRR